MAEAMDGLFFAVLPPGEKATSQAAFPVSHGMYDLRPTTGVRPEDLRIDLGGSTMTAEIPRPRRTATLEKCGEDLGNRLLLGMTSLSELSCSAEEKAKQGIPAAATRFAWCSPIETESRVRAICLRDDHLWPLLEGFKDPDLVFLIYGGFVFLDAADKVHCVMTLGSCSQGQGSAAFAAPQQWLQRWTKTIGERRFQSVAGPAFAKAGVQLCAWIAPNEDIGGVTLGPYGGFVYLLAGGIAKCSGVLNVLDNRKAQEFIHSEKLLLQILRLFQQYDQEKTGLMSTATLVDIFQRIGPPGEFPEDALKALVSDLEKKNGEGTVNYKDFLSLCYGRSVVDDDQVVQGFDDTSMATTAVARLLPDLPRLCILGGRNFQNPLSRDFVEKFGDLCTERLAGKVLLLTGGMPGVQETFAKRLGPGVQSVHLLPVGEASNYGTGKDLAAGMSLPDRMAIFALLGDIYVSVEGGPGVAKEAREAVERGAHVIPVQWTGGASSGMMDFPTSALQCPSSYASAEEWSTIQDKGSRSDAELVTGSADGLVKLLSKLIESVTAVPKGL
mmetsp:Transcript_43068/g.99103  ORF Transcript_43068/g.99103 Transcript_43068/m.99103 type:complete len:556 (+) Transcript_43068:85-1752(+)